MSTDPRAIDPPAPGLYEDVPADTYHRWRGASQSRLKTMRDKSPAHMRHEMEHPAEPTPSQIIGAATHDAVLLPDIFDARWKRAPEGDKRRKAVKEAWAEMEDRWPDATILRADDYDTCIAVRDAVAAHPVAQALLGGEAERSAVWRDPETGVLCKGRFDDIARDVGALTDLKTTRDASRAAFTRAIYNYGYYIQAAHYLEGARAHGIGAEYFTIIAVEKEPPWAVAVYHIRDDALHAGAEELRPLLERWAECEESGQWPAYPEEAVEISLPPYAWKQIDERLERF